MNDKRKPILWEKVFKIRVINPTGWSMQHGQLVKKVYERKISRREFWRRLQFSFYVYI